MTFHEILKNAGFPYPENLIMAFIGGSTQHGAKADCKTCGCDFSTHRYHDTLKKHFCVLAICSGGEGIPPDKPCEGYEASDTDYYGIFIPPKEKTLGIDSFESFVFPGDVSHRTRGERDPQELDIALHSLQKWAGMAAKGNPTVISFLFAKTIFEANESGVTCVCGQKYNSKDCFPCWNCTAESPDFDAVDEEVGVWSIYPWKNVIDNKDIFLAKSHHLPFIHYAHDQMQRLLGLRGQKNINRDHLVDLYGYDTKYAMHIIRLLSEAKELMEHGRITYPRPEVDLLKDIRRGKYKLTEIHQMGEQLNAEVLAAVSTSPLPEKVDRAAISELIANIHLEYYA